MKTNKIINKLTVLKKYKYFLSLALFIGFLFCGATFVSAMEVTLPGLSNNPTLGQYAAFLFNWIIGLAASLSVISFIVGAIGYMISADSAEAKSNGKDRMKGALLGLVLTFASFLIIDLINPNLENFNSSNLPTVAIPIPAPEPGVYFFSGDGCAGSSSGAVITSQDDFAAIMDLGIKSFKIVDDSTNNINYGVILHKEVGLDNGGECSQPVTTAGCQSVGLDAGAADIFQINIGTGSSTTSSSGNGVTFYSEPNGQTLGARAGFYKVTPESITSPYSQEDPNTMCFDYTNITRPDEYKYKCDGSCGASSGHSNSNTETETGTATDNSGASGGNSGVSCSDSACETFQDCHGSIKIKGSYLVAIYSQNAGSDSSGSGDNGSLYCQTFTKDADNLKTEPIIASGGYTLSSIYIVPIK